MSRLRALAKKIRPAKKAWKSFTDTLRSKIGDLRVPKTVNNVTRRIAASLRSLYFLLPLKRRRALSDDFYTSFPREQKFRHYRPPHCDHNFSAVHIDELFPENAKNRGKEVAYVQVETNRGKHIMEENVSEEKSRTKTKSIYSVEEVWNAVVASSPQLRGVDERAEEFIRNFHKGVKLQKEKSLIEFQEMLARGT